MSTSEEHTASDSRLASGLMSQATEPTETKTPEEGGLVSDVLDSFIVKWTNSAGEPEEGPLYVLWELIESYRVDIFEVSLLRITNDFIQFIRSADSIELDLASSFAVMASRLLFYKSRALLPDPGFEESEDEPRLPPELVQQLLEYRRFQLAAEQFRELESITTGMLVRETGLVPSGDDQDEWLDVHLSDLIDAYARVLERIDTGSAEDRDLEIHMESISVDEKMNYLRGLLEQSQSFTFDELFEDPRALNLGELVATFLALLELTKQGEIILRQPRNFQEIRIFKKSVLVH